MSTQPPPPPNQPPYGQPPPPPPPPSGHPPPYGPPAGGQAPPPGGQPPPYGPSPGGQPPYGGQPPQPYGAPPGKGGSGKTLIAVIVIVALVVAGGAVGGFLLLGDDDDNDGSSTELSGETIEGDGYAYSIPEGWADDTEEVGADVVDSIVRAEAAEDGFRTNVLVEVHPAQGTTDVEEIRSTWESNVGGAVGGTPEQIESTTIDGVDAVGLRVESTQQGNDVVQVAYLTINDDKVYSIAMSTGASAEEDATATFDEILDGWEWQ